MWYCTTDILQTFLLLLIWYDEYNVGMTARNTEIQMDSDRYSLLKSEYSE